MKKITIALFLISIFTWANAQVNIVSSGPWSKSFSTNPWTKDNDLVYRTSPLGEVVYAYPNYQDFTKTRNIIIKKDFWNYYKIGPVLKRDWTFELPIFNVNSARNTNYFAYDKRKKQPSSQIYWGFTIGYQTNGKEKQTTIWIKRSNKKYSTYGETYDSEKYISYRVDDGEWRDSYSDYPSNSVDLKLIIDIHTSYTNISWAGLNLKVLPEYIEKINYLSIHVGCLASIQVGAAKAFSSEYASPDCGMYYVSNQQYSQGIEQLENSQHNYYECQALTLAHCYLGTRNFSKVIEFCNALINYDSYSKKEAYLIRGIANEYLGYYSQAQADYNNAQSYSDYDRVTGKIKSQQTQSRQQTTQAQTNKQKQTTTKPPLTK